MALLLATWQKLKLIRERNQLVLEQTQDSSKLTRVQKNIERANKRYTSLFAQLDKQAQMMKSQAQVHLRNIMGLGTGSVDPYNFTGLNQYVYTTASTMFAQGYKYQTGKDADGKPTYATYETDPAIFAKMYSTYAQNGKFLPVVDETTKEYKKTTIAGLEGEAADKEFYDYGDEFNAMDVEAFNQALNQAKVQQQQAQMWVQNTTVQYENNVSIWAEAQRAQLEAEQDAYMEPLNYQETMLQLEKDQKEMRLKRIEAEIQSYTELANKEAENSAPTFGLR